MSNAALDAVLTELAARNPGLWLEVRGEILVYFDDTVMIYVTIPDADPFEPKRLTRIFDIAEDVIVKHIPRDIPIRDDTDTWSVQIETCGDRAMIDAIVGGRDSASRRYRLSDSVGPGTREAAQPPDG